MIELLFRIRKIINDIKEYLVYRIFKIVRTIKMDNYKVSIRNDKMKYKKALKEAYKEFPPKSKYYINIDDCNHYFGFRIYCDGRYDIIRCNNCGYEKIVLCKYGLVKE